MSIEQSIPRIFRALFNVTIMLALMLGSALVVTPVYAAGITVNTTLDENNSGPDCSLREAITAANTNSAYGGCSSGSGVDIITLPAGTYTLTLVGAGEDANASGDLDITDDVSINGAGMGSTIIQAGATPGSGIDRVFDIFAGRRVNISGVTIANGKCASGCRAGGIRNAGSLTVSNSTLSGNSADYGGGLSNSASGSLTLTNSTLSANSAVYGGGIIVDGGTLTLTNNVFSGNSASYGGGLYNGGSLSVTNSTFTGNTAINGAGLYNDVGATLSVANSTFTGNNATSNGGGIINHDTAIVTNSTFSSNSAVYGGAMLNFGTLTVNNSTLSGNSASTRGGGLYESSSGAILHLTNTILANSTGGGDCFNGSADDTIATNIANLIETNAASPNMCGTPAVTADPGLGALANNGGATQTFAITDTSSAYNAGDNSSCAATDQRGLARPQNGICDLGAYEVPDTIAPGVGPISLANADPTDLRSVHFSVSFSESVTGVDPADFILATSGITGASVTGVSGSGSSYIVTVNSGSGNGTLRLDVPASATIVDLAANSLAGLPYTGGPHYTVNKTMTFRSIGANDGWVLESSENSNTGGTLNASAITFNLGDDAANRQYRAILHFNTAGLPDTAVITKATLKIKRQGLVGINPFGTHGVLRAYLRKPYFGSSALQLSDFQAMPASPLAASFSAMPVLNWYSALLNVTGRSLVNRTGTTQFRLLFALDDNNDQIADYMRFYSGNFATAGSQPTLVIEYYVP